MEFQVLAASIMQINDKASSTAKSAVNQLMTLRNWEKRINQKGMNATLFKVCRQFYKVYPQIGSTVSSKFELPGFGKSSTLPNQFVTDPDALINNLSFSHIREIMGLTDAFERFFL